VDLRRPTESSPATCPYARPRGAQAGAHDTLETVTTAAEHRCEALTISDIPPYRCTTSATADRRGRARSVPAMPVRCASAISILMMSEPGKPGRCQAVTTAKGKPCQCDKPATVERGGHAGCLKHDQAVWIEYAQPALP
jgi:hypothetical protein